MPIASADICRLQQFAQDLRWIGQELFPPKIPSKIVNVSWTFGGEGDGVVVDRTLINEAKRIARTTKISCESRDRKTLLKLRMAQNERSDRNMIEFLTLKMRTLETNPLRCVRE